VLTLLFLFRLAYVCGFSGVHFYSRPSSAGRFERIPDLFPSMADLSLKGCTPTGLP